MWWLTFTTKMNYVTHKFPSLVADHNMSMSKETRLDTFIPFYLSDDFQRWSMLNQDIKMPNGPTTYKQPIKDLIIELFGDKEFIQNKGKELSTIKTVELNWHSNWIKNTNVNYARLSDGTYYSKGNDLSLDQVESLINGKNKLRM
jgi:sporulation protein YlmC with PRC-barrel domain